MGKDSVDSLETAAPVSRRRQALMAQASKAAPPAALSTSDVQALQNDPSAEGRAALARKFGNSFDSLASSRTKDLAHAILGLLVDDIEKEVRKSLAETVGASHKLPAAVARKLATDDIEVATPILQSSPVLTDGELVEIVRTNAMQYALAVAGRERISEKLSATLVDSGEQEVVVRLVGNLGAKLSGRTMSRIMEDYQESDAVQDRLVRRPELPYDMVEQMVGVIGDRLEWELINQKRVDRDQARMIMKAVRERTAIGLTARDHGDKRLLAHLRERHLAGEIGPEEVLRFLRDGDIAGFELSLALLAQLEPAVVRRLAYHSDRQFLAALAVRSDFPCAHYITLRMALELAEATIDTNGLRKAYNSETVQFLQSQYERLRLDDLKVEELINGV